MEIIWGVACLLLTINLAMTWFLRKDNKQPQFTMPHIPAPQVNVNLQPLQHAIDELPNKVLQSITGSGNTYKGALGELIGYIKLHADYDRIIPIGNIVDFVCIRFPSSDGNPGSIDFIDIKTGDRSRLSKDQKELQKIIQEKRISFIKLQVETTTVN